jgi:hypothetical protein
MAQELAYCLLRSSVPTRIRADRDLRLSVSIGAIDPETP